MLFNLAAIPMLKPVTEDTEPLQRSSVAYYGTVNSDELSKRRDLHATLVGAHDEVRDVRMTLSYHTSGYEPAGSAMRWLDACWRVSCEQGDAIRSSEAFRSQEEAVRRYQERVAKWIKTQLDWSTAGPLGEPAQQKPARERYYVSMTWDDFPEGGSFGTIVEAASYAEAETLCRQEMAETRADDDVTEEDVLAETFADEWHTVDCFPLDRFIKRNSSPKT